MAQTHSAPVCGQEEQGTNMLARASTRDGPDVPCTDTAQKAGSCEHAGFARFPVTGDMSTPSGLTSIRANIRRVRADAGRLFLGITQTCSCSDRFGGALG